MYDFTVSFPSVLQTHRQTYRNTDRQTDAVSTRARRRTLDVCTTWQYYRHIDRHIKTQTERQTDRQTHGQYSENQVMPNIYWYNSSEGYCVVYQKITKIPTSIQLLTGRVVNNTFKKYCQYQYQYKFQKNDCNTNTDTFLVLVKKYQYFDHSRSLSTQRNHFIEIVFKSLSNSSNRRKWFI